MKKIILFTLMILSLLFIIPFSNAALNCGFSTPAPTSSTSIGQNASLNVSFAVTAGENPDSVNVSYFLQSAAVTRNTTLSNIGNISNSSAVSAASFVGGKDYVNYSFFSQQAVDEGNDYTLSCSCVATGGLSATCNATRTSMTVDRFIPTAPASITFATPVLAGNTITSTLQLANANRCWIHFGGQSTPRNAMTLSGTTCTYTIQADSPPNSDYQAFIENDDRTNVTFSSTQNIVVRARVSDGGGVYGGTAILNEGQSTGVGQSIFGSSNPLAPKSGFNLSSIPPLGWLLIAGASFLVFGGKNKK